MIKDIPEIIMDQLKVFEKKYLPMLNKYTVEEALLSINNQKEMKYFIYDLVYLAQYLLCLLYPHQIPSKKQAEDMALSSLKDQFNFYSMLKINNDWVHTIIKFEKNCYSVGSNNKLNHINRCSVCNQQIEYFYTCDKRNCSICKTLIVCSPKCHRGEKDNV